MSYLLLLFSFLFLLFFTFLIVVSFVVSFVLFVLFVCLFVCTFVSFSPLFSVLVFVSFPSHVGLCSFPHSALKTRERDTKREERRIGAKSSNR